MNIGNKCGGCREDLEMTRRLCEAGKLIKAGIREGRKIKKENV